MAGDDRKVAGVFAIPDFWRTSKWLDQLPPDDTTSFFSKRLTDASDLPRNALIYAATQQDRLASQDGFFKVPRLENAEDQESVDQEVVDDAQTADDSIAETDLESDAWAGLDQAARKGPALQTWESFLNRTTPNSQPMLLTEAGPAAYDALLSWTVDPLQLKNTDIPVVDAEAYFASLLALALGRESVLFSKGEDGQSFKPALPRMRISGYSANVLQRLEKECLSCGICLLGLRSFVQEAYSQNTTLCGVALASAIDEVLRALQENVVEHRQRPRSLLQLQVTIKEITAVLRPFHKLRSELNPNCSDADIVSLVFEHAHSAENDKEWLRHAMQEVLRRVSRPWTGFMEEWIGTKQEEGIPFTHSSVGESRGFVKVEAEVYMDDFGVEVEDVDFRLDRSKMPHFMPEDVIQTAFETGRNLRFIKSSHPDHPLAQPDVIAASKPPKAEWLYGWDAILQLESRVAEYRNQLLDSIEKSGVGNRSSAKHLAIQPGLSDRPSLDFFSLDERGMEERVLASIDQFNAPVLGSDCESPLALIIRQHLRSDDHHAMDHFSVTPHWSLLPVLSFGSIISSQAQVINRETLRLLFRSYDLRGHLSLLRDFHLLGNGIFCSRLSHALFDPNLERADREAGVARQGGVMGLRLGGRNTWPPASSEMRLALMGVLTESYNYQAQPSVVIKSMSRDDSDLPGELSFAVRDMSDEEIDKCMDADSLEALDFLRLSYKAPRELRVIITPMILMQYDRIFKLLLRVLRMLYIVNQLWREVTNRGDDREETSYRFAREAHHFVSSIAAYFLDVGVAVPWRTFEDKLKKIQESLDNHVTEKLESPEQLREFHSSVLHGIMLALFLRKRQEPVLKLLGEIFTLILQFAKMTRRRDVGMDNDNDAGQGKLYTRFKKKVQVFITVCRGLAEKSRMGTKTDDDEEFKLYGIGDESMVAQLLLKLDINEYYAKH